MMGNIVIHESDNLKAELEHDSDETSSDYMSSEWDNSQYTDHVAVPRKIMSDKGTSQSYFSYLDLAAKRSFPSQIYLNKTFSDTIYDFKNIINGKIYFCDWYCK